MTTYNTGNPIGSTDSRDRLDNTENMDYLENSTTELTHPDRLGTVRKTRHGMEVEHDAQIAAHESEHDAQIAAHESEHDAQMQSFENDFDGRLAGMAFTRVGSFTTGATLTDMRQVLVWEVSQGGDGHEYGWAGAFPKVVAAGATPATSGGIGAGAWVDRTDVTLRGEIREYVNQAQEEIINGKIFPESGVLSNGMTVPTGTTHLRVLVDGETTIVAMSPIVSGTVSLLTESTVTIGGTPTGFTKSVNTPTVSTMKKLNLPEGFIVTTSWYANIFDKGGASYTIKTPSQASSDGDIIDELSNHTLNNGNLAVLTPTCETSPFSSGALGEIDDPSEHEKVQSWLNAMANSGVRTAKLNGDFYVDSLIIDEKFNGMDIGYGTLRKTATPLLTNQPIILGRGYLGNFEDVSFSDIYIKGLAQFTGDFEADDPANTASKQFFTGISIIGTPTARARNIHCTNIRVEGVGNNGVAFDSVEGGFAKNIHGTNVNKHPFAASVIFGGFGAPSRWPQDFRPYMEVDGLYARRCGTVFDFSTVGDAKNDDAEVTATGRVSNATGHDIYLRTKVHGTWDFEIDGFSAINSTPDLQINGPYSGLDFANVVYKNLNISNVYVKNFAAAIRTEQTVVDAELNINNLRVVSCMVGVSTGMNVNINGYYTDDCFAPLYLASSGNGETVNISNYNFKKSRRQKWIDIINSKPKWSFSLPSYPITSESGIDAFNLVSGCLDNFGEEIGDPSIRIGMWLRARMNNIVNMTIKNSPPQAYSDFIRPEGAVTKLSSINEVDAISTTFCRLLNKSGNYFEGSKLFTDNVTITSPFKFNEEFNGTLNQRSEGLWMWDDGTNLRFSRTEPNLISDGTIVA